MNGGSKIIGLRREDGSAGGRTGSSGEELLLEEYYTSDNHDRSRLGNRLSLIRWGLAASALLWAVFNLFAVFGGSKPLPSLAEAPTAIASFAVPLVLIGTLYLLLIRNSRAESRRFADTADSLRKESDALEQKLSRIGTQLINARAAMQEQASLLENYGASASANMEASAKLIAASAAQAADHTVNAERAGAELAGQLTELVRTLPALQERATSMSAQLMETSQAMTGRIDSLERRLQAVMAISDDARLRTLSATKSLTTQLAQLQEETRSASDEINGMAEAASGRIDVAINGARSAIQETGTGLEVHAATINALVEQARTSLSGLGGETINSFSSRSDQIEKRLLDLNRLIQAHGALAAGLSDTLEAKLTTLESQFADFERDGVTRNERLSATLTTIAGEAERLEKSLAIGNGTAEQLITRSESLLLALDSSVREMEETYPAALSRLDGRVEESRQLLATTQPEIEKLEAVSEAILGRTQETGQILEEHAGKINRLLATAQDGFSASRGEIEQLQMALQSADEGAQRLRESAGPQLVAALVRVKDTAEQASERARQALARAIPDAVRSLSDASEEALTKALGEQVAAQIAQVNAIAEKALNAAEQATEALDRKLAALSETSAAVEEKMAEVEARVEAQGRNSYTHRSAQLIESLNSAAIDVARVLSSDVTDNDWTAYLKGDRGVFTRRAVRLLDAGEAREIALQYDGSTEFREHVNRYIHDFEGMLRIILAARDGNTLAVTLLSSDMGKLYVALAQAIDRLR